MYHLAVRYWSCGGLCPLVRLRRALGVLDIVELTPLEGSRALADLLFMVGALRYQDVLRFVSERVLFEVLGGRLTEDGAVGAG